MNTVLGKNGGVEFWQIAVDKANSEEYFGESGDRSLIVVSPYLQALLGGIKHHSSNLQNFHYPIFSHVR